MEPPRNVSEWLRRYVRPPRPAAPGPHSVAELLEHIPLDDGAGHAIRWSRREARRLLFVFWLLDHGRIDQVSTPLAGIDISHYQARTPPLGATLEFVFVKASEGTAVDPMWATHAATVRSAGKVLGAYHFGLHGISPKAQAAAFLHTIGPVQLVALDLERPRVGTIMTHDEARIFIAAVQASGRKVGLYASEGNWPGALGQDFKWVAKWGTEQPVGPWAFWQWGGTGVDRDRFNGTIEQLHALAGIQPKWEVQVPAGTPLRLFTVEHTAAYPNGVITHVQIRKKPWTAVVKPCSPKRNEPYPWPGHVARKLVKLQDGGYVLDRYAREVEA